MLNKRPSTPARAAAARANGAKSRGAATPEGKAQCSGTRLRHGLWARDPLSMAVNVDIDPELVEDHFAELTAEYQPASPSLVRNIRAAAELLALRGALQQRFAGILKRHTCREPKEARNNSSDRADLNFITLFFRLEKAVDQQVECAFARLDSVRNNESFSVGSPECIENTVKIHPNNPAQNPGSQAIRVRSANEGRV
jgi:hypothetical protein